MSKAAELTKVFMKLTSVSGKYCSICLRTGAESRLVRPRYFKKFVTDTQLEFPVGPRSYICYMCESQASQACKFYEAVSFAIQIRMVLKSFLRGSSELNELQLRQKLLDTLKKKLPLKKTVKSIECDLKKVRARTRLFQTDMLCFSCPEMEPTGEQQDPGEEYIVPDSLVPVNGELSYTRDTVILSDDNDCDTNDCNLHFGPKPTPRPSFGDSIPIDPNIHNQVFEGTTLSLDLFNSQNTDAAIAQNDTNTIYVPTMIDNCCIMIPDNNIFQLQNAGTPIQITNGPHLILPENKLLQANNASVQSTSAGIPTVAYSQAQNISRVNNAPVKVYEEARVFAEGGGEGARRAAEASSGGDVKKQKTEVKAPVQKNDRIDWEDKIPMDVISFADAVDPNAHCILKQNLEPRYEISNVRSLKHNNRSSAQKSNIVDLC